MPFMPLLIVAIWPPMVRPITNGGQARPRDLAVVAMLLMMYCIELARRWMFLVGRAEMRRTVRLVAPIRGTIQQ